MGVAWAWSTLSELLAYPNGSKFSLGQRGSDNRGWTVIATPACGRALEEWSRAVNTLLILHYLLYSML